MALGTGLRQPRFDEFVTGGCAFLVLVTMFGAMVNRIEEDTDPALLEIYNARMVDFYDGYVVAPRWQQVATGYSTAAQIEEDVTGVNKSSRQEFKRLRERFTDSDRDAAQEGSFKRAVNMGVFQLSILVVSVVVVLAFRNHAERAERDKYVSYLGQWTIGSIAAAALRVFAAIFLGLLILGASGGFDAPFLFLLILVPTYLLPTFLLVKCFFPHWKVFVKSVRFEKCFLRTPTCWFYVCAGILLTLPIINILMAILQKFIGSSPEITDFLDPMLVNGGTTALMAQLVVVGVVAPVSEEILCRGFIFTTLRRHIGVPGAALVTSFVFAGVHFYSWIGLVAIFFLRTRVGLSI